MKKLLYKRRNNYHTKKTPLPLIIYTIETLEPEYTKDGWVGDICNFNIYSFCNDYTILQSIVKQIRVALEYQRDSTTSFITLKGQREGYNLNENVFLNELNFETEFNII